MQEPEVARRALVAVLRAAYSAERTAYIAYRGHERALRDPRERAEIRRIGRQELVHRKVVGGMLAALGETPSARRERWMPWIGRLIWLWCQVGGWFTPMYGAGRLERDNIDQYVDAARLAIAAGRPEFVEACVEMAEVEWDHERWFHEKVRSHWLARVFPDWSDPRPRGSYRESLATPARSETPSRSTPNRAAMPA